MAWALRAWCDCEARSVAFFCRIPRGRFEFAPALASHVLSARSRPSAAATLARQSRPDPGAARLRDDGADWPARSHSTQAGKWERHSAYVRHVTHLSIGASLVPSVVEPHGQSPNDSYPHPTEDDTRTHTHTSAVCMRKLDAIARRKCSIQVYQLHLVCW